ncbi:hypothetical protein ES705_20871 [subsurface metagenome]
MSSGKANINYSMEYFDFIKVNNISSLPVFEEKDLIHLKQQDIVNKLNKFYGKIIDVHFFLLNNKELTNNQKLDYCSIERHFMKLYLKEVIKKG